MAEWSNAHDSKSCYVGTRTGVRIPLSAPYRKNAHFYAKMDEKCAFFYTLFNAICPILPQHILWAGQTIPKITKEILPLLLRPNT